MKVNTLANKEHRAAASSRKSQTTDKLNDQAKTVVDPPRLCRSDDLDEAASTGDKSAASGSKSIS